ncbi:1-acyl-sn-glycerol-3-phosphate acyltransferase [Plebeiibacterium sediminum]|uniref:1-acyl-sn-glycerol-3-phosphate acyltransferase n=1 Tax=Plebeiibacterium sediminum TaxID=2992112 RepID=A0AAE3M7H2_9BACT|nr:1-acyl-sn-glycerol-3-phosphate acyltransferase [Plebeiobacterium sediminum]MCW3788406.1 1-acyl-sn-glycerol-3-phosphate acyltransferase [Plebeiobacterium sediminum]
MEEQNKKTITIDVEKVFKEKNAGLYKILPKFIFSYLKKVIHQDSLNHILNKHPDSYNVDFGEECKKLFGVTSSTEGLDKIPKDGRYLFVANHPLGGLDGIIFMTEVGKVFPDIKFPVNDILLQIGRFNDIFVPINKHGGQAKNAAIQIENAFQSESQMLFFPAGLVSRKQGNVIKDLDWKPAFIKKAIKHKRDIVPVYISGNNSKFFYNLSRFRKLFGIKANLEMLYLVDEMFKFKNRNVKLTFGDPIPWETVQKNGSAKEWAEKIKETVYSLPKLI